MGLGRVLIVEDEEITQTLYKRLLDRMDCRYEMVSSLKEARQLMLDNAYTLLVTDVRLPDGHGTELVGDFRRRNPSAKVLIVTGSPQSPSAEKKMDVDCQGAEWLFKPFELDDFTAAVARLLSQSKSPA